MHTRDARASAIGIALAFRVVLPEPDTALEQPDRQHVAFSYAEISAAEPPVEVGVSSLNLLATYVTERHVLATYVPTESRVLIGSV